jgi:hypothetical protein
VTARQQCFIFEEKISLQKKTDWPVSQILVYGIVIQLQLRNKAYEHEPTGSANFTGRP